MESYETLFLGRKEFLGCEILCVDISNILEHIRDVFHDIFCISVIGELHLESESAINFKIFNSICKIIGIIDIFEQFLNIFNADALSCKTERYYVVNIDNFGKSYIAEKCLHLIGSILDVFLISISIDTVFKIIDIRASSLKFELLELHLLAGLNESCSRKLCCLAASGKNTSKHS